VDVAGDVDVVGDVLVGVGVVGDGDVDVRTDAEGEGLGDADRGDVEVYVDDGAYVLAAEEVPPYGDVLAAEETLREADGEAAPEAVRPPEVGAFCDEVSAAGWDGNGVDGCPVNDVSANAAAPEATRSTPRTQASTSGRHSLCRGRLVVPSGR
jgi:hypothetical protein